MKKMMFGLALAIASASSFAGWSPTWVSGSFKGTMTYGATATGATTSVSVSEAKGTRGEAVGPIGLFEQQALGAYTQLQTSLNSWAQSTAVAAGATASTGTLTGTLTASIAGLTGAEAGMNQISFGGASYAVAISKSGSSSGISYTCTASLSLSNLAIVAVYAPVTGVIDPTLSSIDYSTTSSTSCSTSLDWVPIIGSVVDNILEAKVNSAVVSLVNSFSTNAIQSLLPYGPSYLGVNSAIASGVYVFDGVDWGAYIKNNFASLFTGKALTITIAQPKLAAATSGTVEPAFQYTNTEFLISFTDSTRQLSFAVSTVDTYKFTYSCTGGNVACNIP